MGRVKRLPYRWIHEYMPRWWEKNWKSKIVKERYTTEKIMKWHSLWWYRRVSLCDWGQKSTLFLIHRLVYFTFNSIDRKFLWQKTNTLVLHKNDIRDDNRLDNLFLWTQDDNIYDMIRKWRHRTWRSKKVKIWFDDVQWIKEKYNEIKSIYKVATLYWVSYATISRVINWKAWNNRTN